nr:MAG TPA: hypothetical protein [Caudoviricetes sp.]
MNYINEMLPNEVSFLPYRFSTSDVDSVDPSSKSVLKFATTVDNEKFIDLLSVHENGLVLLVKSEDHEVWSNRKPISNTVDGKVVITFESE